MPTHLLDRVALKGLRKKRYARVFEPHYGDVMQSNPKAGGRFSRKEGYPLGNPAAASWYISETVQGALWESVLRDVYPIKGDVRVDPAKLEKSWFQWVERVDGADALHLDPIQRRALIDDRSSSMFSDIDALVQHRIYEMTHMAAGLLWLQADAQKIDLPGIAWISKQTGKDKVCVLYDPPLDRSKWQAVGAPLHLGSSKGRAMVRRALKKEGFRWINDPKIPLPRPTKSAK